MSSYKQQQIGYKTTMQIVPLLMNRNRKIHSLTLAISTATIKITLIQHRLLTLHNKQLIVLLTKMKNNKEEEELKLTEDS